RLSGGERQRVAIARAISGGAPVLLADEPTGNLDSASSQAVMDLLQELSGAGTTVVVVTHDPAVAARADRRVRVVDGRVSEETRRLDPGSAQR
nr:ATP-binding cassette domain-containing protein [Streptococcus anginosus]